MLESNCQFEFIHFLPCNCHTIPLHFFASICTIVSIMSSKISDFLDFVPDNITISDTTLDLSGVLDINTESMTLGVTTMAVVIETVYTEFWVWILEQWKNNAVNTSKNPLKSHHTNDLLQDKKLYIHFLLHVLHLQEHLPKSIWKSFGIQIK